MTVKVNGKDEWTVAEVAQHFGVSAQTIGTWIDRKVVEDPPRIRHGLRKIRYFTQDWVKRAEAALEKRE